MSTPIVEFCPGCEQEVKLRPVLMKQKCPKCGLTIKPCALCDMDVVDRRNCILDHRNSDVDRFSIVTKINNADGQQ